MVAAKLNRAVAKSRKLSLVLAIAFVVPAARLRRLPWRQGAHEEGTGPDECFSRDARLSETNLA